MKIKNCLFTSESVTIGHPDAVIDGITASLCDEMLARDPKSRIALEGLVTTGQVVLAGEVTTGAYIDIPEVVRETIRKIGYNRPGLGFSADEVSIIQAIKEQSPDIAMGVDRDGAGDIGVMFGGACNETKELMPTPIAIARALTKRMTELVGKYDNLRPDGKAQVAVYYDENGKPAYVDNVVICQSHDDCLSEASVRRTMIDEVVIPVLKEYGYEAAEDRIYTNPTGKFVICGPKGDCGVTGRKLVVDSYGGFYRIGGGAAFCKDPTKVDLSAQLACRYIAVNFVKAGLCEDCEAELSYAIGKAEPTSLFVTSHGTSKHSDEYLTKLANKYFALTPRDIIRKFDLTNSAKIQYFDLKKNGMYGRTDRELPWEVADLAEVLKREAE